MSLECSKYAEGKVKCNFSGRLDTVQCINVEKQLMENINGAEVIVFDLNGVEYIASSFFRLCGKASHIARPGNFSVINVTPSVKKVFKIAGLAEILNLS